MKSALVAVLAAPALTITGLFFVAPASASPGWQNDVLCSSNIAYRNAHKALCADISIGSHGGGGGYQEPEAEPDSDGGAGGGSTGGGGSEGSGGGGGDSE
ncbi:hypothetical protein PBI_ASTRAEA_26 [Mycobacterium phage Astraea]|nr:hypothetical protein M182_gp027 [Mycobacterium phage Astraea]YP_009597621.1 hypothetical protein FDH18_gp018 [Mycobacterium phage Lukilu]ACU41550.1 hypothetical protein LRRHOOD_22 [Mycobacterium phage LRRHood]QAY04985.1 hypothetical protein SEA_SHAQNATO_21 [Mycobacterium phage Shaqnato]QDP44387.1 hypothetical protein SEA_GRUNGLE_18 [Mycobacterium phage Grungle]UEM46085.1 hypothetical protein SEA_PINKCREEK_17 [Mycobacterium phage Pinkcreek]AGM12991.1 hypothetical protein PBI_ASTRAEA_26 [Myc